MRLQAQGLRIPRAGRAGALLLAAGRRKKSYPRVAFFFSSLAERGGFEPPIEYYPIHAFQACAFSRSAISPACNAGVLLALLLAPLVAKPQIIARNHQTAKDIYLGVSRTPAKAGVRPSMPQTRRLALPAEGV